MLAGIHKDLCDLGFIRTKWVHKSGWVKDYKSMHVSTYGPMTYKYQRGDLVIYWGLGLADKKTPYFYLPGLEEIELTINLITSIGHNNPIPAIP